MTHPDTPLTAALARALIRSLSRGTAVAEGARFIHVGQRNWLDAQLEMLAEVAEDEHSETKFVRGAYGAGKSHFLSVVQDYARECNWVTSHVECKFDRVEIDRFETLYPKITEKLLIADLATVDTTAGSNPGIDPVRHLIDRWARTVLRKAGFREDALTRPFDADQRVYGYFQQRLLRSTLPIQFVQALMGFTRAALAGDHDATAAVCSWLKGSPDSLTLAAAYLANPKTLSGTPKPTVIRPIGKSTVHDVMRGLLWLIRDAGYAGLVLCIDEVEELARLPTQKRQDQALQALREFVDHAGGEGGYRSLCMYLAATPEMFESARYFLRYDALATRIQAFGSRSNLRGPIVDLERTPLNRAEMIEVARAVKRVHATAYGPPSGAGMTEAFMNEVIDSVLANRHRLAKPRLLARVLVDELERMRSEGKAYRPTADMPALTASAAAAVIEGQTE
jgi:hypothetical protein